MRTITALILCTALAAAQALPVSTPEQEGMSSERFKRLHARFSEMVEKGTRAGASTLVLRNGKVVDLHTYGFRDLGRKLPMEKDTICRIWSMTKVITSVAAMMLVEEGKLTLTDPVSKHVPELKQMRVLTGGTADSPVLAEATRPITVKHLLTHTSGLTYAFTKEPVPELYRRVKIFEAPSLKAFIAKVASVPLIAQPGEKYNYGINTDVLGYVVEVASGMPFDKFVQSRILTPLGMNDTHWVVPDEKLSRLAKTYSLKDGKLSETSMEGIDAPAGVPYGMGLYSTIGDYAKFGQMLLNGGQLNGVRLLSRKTVELMTGNHLSTLKVPSIDANGAYGFGLGGSVRLEVAKANIPGSPGQFGWDGAASTSFRMDPKLEKLVTVLFQQSMPFDTPSIELFSTLVYQAIVD